MPGNSMPTRDVLPFHAYPLDRTFFDEILLEAGYQLGMRRLPLTLHLRPPAGP